MQQKQTTNCSCVGFSSSADVDSPGWGRLLLTVFLLLKSMANYLKAEDLRQNETLKAVSGIGLEYLLL